VAYVFTLSAKIANPVLGPAPGLARCDRLTGAPAPEVDLNTGAVPARHHCRAGDRANQRTTEQETSSTGRHANPDRSHDQAADCCGDPKGRKSCVR